MIGTIVDLDRSVGRGRITAQGGWGDFFFSFDPRGTPAFAAGDVVSFRPQKMGRTYTAIAVVVEPEPQAEEITSSLRGVSERRTR